MGVFLFSSILKLFLIRWILSFIFKSFTRAEGNCQGLLAFFFYRLSDIEPYLVILHPKKFYPVGWILSCYLSKFYPVGRILSCYLSKFYPVGWILSCYLLKFYPVGWILSGPEEIASLNPRLGRLHAIKDSRCLQRCLQCIAWDDLILKDMLGSGS